MTTSHFSRRILLAAAALAGVAGVAGAGYWGYRRLTRRSPDFADLAYGTGERQVLDIYLPEGEGPFPFIVEIHGGAFKAGDKAMTEPSELLLSAGFAIVKPNYRLSGTDLWPAQGEDCLAATLFALENAAQYRLDPSRLAVWGQSAGGFLSVSTALSLVEQGRPPKAAVSFFGPMDFSTMDADMAALGRTATMGTTDAAESAESQLLGFAVGTDPAKAKAMGPVGRLESMSPRPLPALFVRHGDADPLIAHGQSERLVAAWSRVDPAAPVDFALVAGAGHGGADFDSEAVMGPLAAFLTKAAGA